LARQKIGRDVRHTVIVIVKKGRFCVARGLGLDSLRRNLSSPGRAFFKAQHQGISSSGSNAVLFPPLLQVQSVGSVTIFVSFLVYYRWQHFYSATSRRGKQGKNIGRRVRDTASILAAPLSSCWQSSNPRVRDDVCRSGFF